MLPEDYVHKTNGVTDKTPSSCSTASASSCPTVRSVLGDNRQDSQASNHFGPIDEDLIVGRAFLRAWPLGAFRNAW